ncbi:hypothetical protein H7J06_31475 [Mycobacterium hodleri]|uniref:relaxase/mobilization nuclease domain-containing protein n=1 Tax=Mycolicibacterium hodleri TaxID=49897 RepID=UPI0021F2738A|nr:relaxase/mobilization nuclease domain-containing protein [Mycolicibacterium hodleri]MCV7137493.1 hypothetical protein [Mycolicibacterium hodleri]
MVASRRHDDDERQLAVIAKITHGRSAVRALAYDHGPGRADEHVHPRKVGGNVPGRDWQQRAQRMQRFVTAHQHYQKDQGRGDRGVYRVALANPEGDRVLSDREWRAVTEKFVTRFGADKGMWEATRHDRHHVHLTISKDRFDGTRMSTSHDFRRAAAICRELEREHGLTNAAERAGRGSGRVRADAEATKRGTPQTDRDWLRATIGRVLAAGGGIEELRAAGVEVRLNRASTGRVSGISYARAHGRDNDSHRDRDQESGGLLEESIWFKGSALGKAYGWNQVSEHLRADDTPQPPTPAVPPTSSAFRDEKHELEPEPLMLELSLELPSATVAQRRAMAYRDAWDRAAERARTQELHRRQDRDR